MTAQNKKGVYIIAEAGVNHNGSYGLALRLIDAAKAASVDCIKFQTFKAESVVSKNAKKAEYQVANTHIDDSQYAMLKKLELTDEQFIGLKKRCEDIGIDFLSTAFDFDSIEFLHSLGCSIWKVPSGEITNLPYLIRIAQYGESVILSTGMATLDEVRAALKALHENGCGQITLLHCTTEYPAPYQDVNLSAMLTMKSEFGLPVGYSDHTQGITIPVAAVAIGATVIEKHFTLDKTMEGPDHKASLEPNELKDMVEAIRQVEAAIGDGEKTPSESEKKNIAVARKSIVAKRQITKGEMLTEENITTKRPGNGLSPMRWYDVLGTAAVRDFDVDDQIVM